MSVRRQALETRKVMAQQSLIDLVLTAEAYISELERRIKELESEIRELKINETTGKEG